MTVWWNAAAAASGAVVDARAGFRLPRTAGTAPRGRSGAVDSDRCAGSTRARALAPRLGMAIRAKHRRDAVPQPRAGDLGDLRASRLAASTLYTTSARPPTRRYDDEDRTNLEIPTARSPTRSSGPRLAVPLRLLSGHAFTAGWRAKSDAQDRAGRGVEAAHPAATAWFPPCTSWWNCRSSNLGPVVERQFGRGQFMAVYLGSGVAG